MMRRQKPTSPSPDYHKLLVFGVLFFFGLVLWGITIYIWFQAYLWFAIVSEVTFIFTFIVLPIPFWLYYTFIQPAGEGASPPTETGVAPAAPTAFSARVRSNNGGWISWLGNGEEHRGLLVLFVIIFSSIFYWTLMYQVSPSFSPLRFAFVFSAWGLITIIGTIMIRALFIRQTTGPEVSAAQAEKKSGK